MKSKLFILISLLAISATAFAQSLSREDVESAFLYHFLNYAEWNDALPDYYVCIPEDAELRRSAVMSLKGKVVNNRQVVVVNQADSCHIMVSENVPHDNSVMTVGPLKKGAMLEFRLINNKVRFAANPHRIKESRVKISSQLLKLAILDSGV